MTPQTRADCLDRPRPCPFTACRHHLETSCVLDEVDAHGALDLRAVGQLFGVSRERIRQIEEMALVRLRRHAGRLQ